MGIVQGYTLTRRGVGVVYMELDLSDELPYAGCISNSVHRCMQVLPVLEFCGLHWVGASGALKTRIKLETRCCPQSL